MYDINGLLIDNTWRPASNRKVRTVVSPVTGDIVGVVPAATDVDIAAALKSAAGSFEGWRRALADLTADGLEVGMVGINESLLATAEAPFGGIKESCFGREGGSLGIKDYLEPKYIRRRLMVRGDLK